MIRATAVHELEPLLDLCRAGKIHEIRDWLEAGRPSALPSDVNHRDAKRNPLRVAMSTGFHSVVQALLEVGAPTRDKHYDALHDAVEQRRPDLAALLLDHGASVDDVSMRLVIEMWQPDMVELFLERGASPPVCHPGAAEQVYRGPLPIFARPHYDAPELSKNR